MSLCECAGGMALAWLWRRGGLSAPCSPGRGSAPPTTAAATVSTLRRGLGGEVDGDPCRAGRRGRPSLGRGRPLSLQVSACKGEKSCVTGLIDRPPID